eukprot:3416037-Amphidinium_carterae.1
MELNKVYLQVKNKACNKGDEPSSRESSTVGTKFMRANDLQLKRSLRTETGSLPFNSLLLRGVPCHISDH